MKYPHGQLITRFEMMPAECYKFAEVLKLKSEVEQVSWEKDVSRLWKDQQQTMYCTDLVSKIRPDGKPIHFCRDTATTGACKIPFSRHTILSLGINYPDDLTYLSKPSEQLLKSFPVTAGERTQSLKMIWNISKFISFLYVLSNVYSRNSWICSFEITFLGNSVLSASQMSASKVIYSQCYLLGHRRSIWFQHNLLFSGKANVSVQHSVTTTTTLSLFYMTLHLNLNFIL